jgi:hypothetical protein
LNATFWLNGDNSSWSIPLPVCFVCTKLSPKIEKDIDMNTTFSTSIRAKDWKKAYRAALFEPDKNKRLERILEAEVTVALRARELFYMGDQAERQAVDAAISALQVLRSTMCNDKGTPRVSTLEKCLTPSTLSETPVLVSYPNLRRTIA